MAISPAFSRQTRVALCLATVLACAPLARAEDAAPGAPVVTPAQPTTPAPVTAPAQPSEENTPAVPAIVGSLYATTALGLSAVDGIPPGFSGSAYDLPIIVGAEATVHGSRTGLDAWADLHGGTQTYGFDPLWGGAFGLGFQAQLPYGTLAARAGLAIEDQATLSHSPVGGSYLDIWRWGFVARAEYTTGIYQPFATFKWWNTPTVQVADYEGLPTEVAWNDTYALALGARVKLPLFLRVEASVAFYSLGAVAIASEEFAYFIGQQPLIEPSAGVGAELGRWEAWLRYSRAFPMRNDDATEYLYQTPAYYNDNLMVRSQLTAEVRWKF